MKSNIKYLLVLVVLFSFISLHSASAQLVQCTGSDITQNPCSFGDLVQSTVNIINFLLSYAWLVSVALIVWAGFQMVMAGGNEETITKAKTTLSHAIIGFVIILMSFLIINAVISILTKGTVNYSQSFFDALQLAPSTQQ